jgi:hypothetical protein
MRNWRPISVITATPPGFNPGMLASQIAARWFLDRHGFGDLATFYRLIPIQSRLAHLEEDTQTASLRRLEDGIDYNVLLNPAQLAESTPLYWGDLLHMRQYHDSIRGLLRNSGATPESLLLLQDSPPDLVNRAVSFGTTVLYHSASDLTADAFGQPFRRFIENANLVMPRDMSSLVQLQSLVPRASVHPGLDVTQLFVGGGDWRTAFPQGTDRSLAHAGSLLCYFARGKHDIADLNQAAGLFSRVFGLPVRWLPWGDQLSFPHLDRYAGQLNLADQSPPAPSLSALLEALTAAKCVLTDTYHVAVIAWSLGTPAFMLRGDHWPGDFNAVVDKRYIFFLQHGLQDFFLANARDHGRLEAFMERGVRLVADGKSLQYYLATVGQRVEETERRLVAALKEGGACA